MDAKKFFYIGGNACLIAGCENMTKNNSGICFLCFDDFDYDKSNIYTVTEKEYKEYWDEDYEIEFPDDDEIINLDVIHFDCCSSDTEWEYSIKWRSCDDKLSGLKKGINTSSSFAMMMSSKWLFEN